MRSFVINMINIPATRDLMLIYIWGNAYELLILYNHIERTLYTALIYFYL